MFSNCGYLFFVAEWIQGLILVEGGFVQDPETWLYIISQLHATYQLNKKALAWQWIQFIFLI